MLLEVVQPLEVDAPSILDMAVLCAENAMKSVSSTVNFEVFWKLTAHAPHRDFSQTDEKFCDEQNDMKIISLGFLVQEMCGLKSSCKFFGTPCI